LAAKDTVAKMDLDDDIVSALYVTPQMFGAIADGETDDTAAIQAALNSLADGGTLYFPPGTYRVKHPDSSNSTEYVVTLTENKKNITMKLDNAATIILPETARGVNIYILFRFVNIDGLEITGGTIAADRNTHPDVPSGYGSKAIHLRNCKNVHIHDIAIKDIFGDGIAVSGI
jgi:polygalacturonase